MLIKMELEAYSQQSLCNGSRHKGEPKICAWRSRHTENGSFPGKKSALYKKF